MCDEGTEQEAVTRLSRVGYDNTLGYLKGGIDAWKAAGKEVDTIESISAEEFADALHGRGQLHVFDVRKHGEWDRRPCGGRRACLPRPELNEQHGRVLARTEPNYIHCQSGYPQHDRGQHPEGARL